MRSILLVALGGALGAVARYGVALAGLRWGGPGLPWGTWGANALGCLLIGVALPLVRDDDARLAGVVGFLGAFTTFSTYSADTVLLWETGRRGLAVANAAGSVLVGLLFVGLGLVIGRRFAAG